MNPPIPDDLQVKQMQKAILQALDDLDRLTFPELLEMVPQARGALALVHGRQPNLVIWDRLSLEAVHAFRLLLIEKEVAFAETPLTTFITDVGQLPQLKAALKIRAYKSPRWLPVLICRGPKFSGG